jgi:hypothetical protein
MKIIALYEDGQAIKELNRFETMSIDIVNAAIASQQPNLFDDIVNASKSTDFENWCRWLARKKLKLSVKQTNLAARNMSMKTLCFDEVNKIFANAEFVQFTPAFGNDYGVMSIAIFQKPIETSANVQNEENNSGTEQKVKINNQIVDNEAFKRKLAADIEENIEIVAELVPMLKSVDFTQFDENALIQIVTKMKQTRMLFKQLTEQ